METELALKAHSTCTEEKVDLIRRNEITEQDAARDSAVLTESVSLLYWIHFV